MTHTPYGYRIEGGKAIIDETAAGQVKELFEDKKRERLRNRFSTIS